MTVFEAGKFDIAVIGAGHAGVEAALAAARLGAKTVCFTINLDAVANMPVLRPLIGNDKVEIIRMAREIGTFETSILPYEDCCTVFTPRHPCTRPVLADIEAAEAALDVDALVAEAMAGEEWIRVKP